MPDKKLTEVDTSTSLADSDKLIGNIGNSVKQITLTNLVTIIKNKIGSLKNPHALTFTGAVDDTYDGSAAKTINIPTGSGGSGTTDYNDLENKPQINGVELSGNKSGNDVGLVNNQQGIANVGKVLGIGQDGLVVPVENAGASDNIIYKDVPKQLNPNITDSFQRAMWDLKLYGQSTQGADPSPTNPQEITAISQFDGNIRNSNQLFDDSKVPTKTQGGVTVTNNGDGSFTISGSGQLSANFIVGSGNLVNVLKKYLHPGEIVIKNELVYPYVYLNLRYTLNDVEYFEQLNSRSLVPFELTEEIINGLTLFDYGFTAGSGTTVTPITIKPVIYQDGDGTWEPFDSNPQEISYTPTNPMYSTQDGSITDYVDVEKGVEVYNMKIRVFDGSPDEQWEVYNINGYNGYDINVSNMRVGLRQKFLCNIYQTNGLQSDSIWFGVNSSFVYFPKAVADTGAQTLEEWRAWLSQNPITIIYQSAIPTEIPIDPEQLAMLKSLYTYTGVTNFLCNAPVSFTYERSLQIVINNLENAIGQTNANILLGGTL